MAERVEKRDGTSADEASVPHISRRERTSGGSARMGTPPESCDQDGDSGDDGGRHRSSAYYDRR